MMAAKMPGLNSLRFVLITIYLGVVTWSVNGRLTYQKKIPNGNRVPNPCKPNDVWNGVGHLNKAGGGKRNPFGVAFQDAGFKWTKALCQADSDKDGKTNGEELGDPGCIWSEGGEPTFKSNLSHPGVCEPVDSAKCSFQKWISCTGKKANCTARYEAGVVTKDIRFPRWNVPAQLTTYYCKTFLLPHDQDYHIVAADPILDNTKVIHHMLLFGCKEDMVIEKKPFDCIMGSAKCNDLLTGWTVGDEGDCNPPNAGFRFGKSIYKYAQLQVHWTNDAKASDLYDSSGFKLYYTPKLRKYDLGVLSTGQLHLELPPGKSEVNAVGVCKPSCTRIVLAGYGAINITSATLHAHFLGKSLSLSQIRNGKFIRYLAKDDIFSYNNPTVTQFDPPVLLQPGDELKTKCVYDTSKKKKTTYYGDGTYEEMCYGFIKYYPKISPLRQELCVSYERYSFCDLEVFKNASYYSHNFGTCNFKEFEEHNYPADILRACGSKAKSCPRDCKFYVDKMLAHRCMKGWERYIHDELMYAKANRSAAAVWSAIDVCKAVTRSPSSKLQPHFGLFALLLLVFYAFYG